MTINTSELIKHKEEGPLTRLPSGEVLTWKVLSETTNGQYDMVEFSTPPQVGPPEHIHRNDEIYYILQGTYRMKLEDHIFDAPEGTLIRIPAGTSHTSMNCGSETARVLVTFCPAVSKAAFDILLDLDFSDEQALAQVADKYGTIITGPPLTPNA